MTFTFCPLPFDFKNGGGENRTLVWQPSSKESTYLAASLEFSLAPGSRSGEEPGANYARRVSLFDSDLHQIASLQSRRSTSGTQAMPERTGCKLGLTRQPLRVQCSQLKFACSLRVTDFPVCIRRLGTPIESNAPPNGLQFSANAGKSIGPGD